MSSKSDIGGSDAVSVWTITISATFLGCCCVSWSLSVDDNGAAVVVAPVTVAIFFSTFFRSDTDDFEVTDDASVVFLVFWLEDILQFFLTITLTITTYYT